MTVENEQVKAVSVLDNGSDIKFRGRDTETDEWVYGFYVEATAAQLGLNDVPVAAARRCWVIVVDGIFFHVNPKTICQYTGSHWRPIPQNNGSNV